MCNDDIRNYNSKISDLGYLTNVLLDTFRQKHTCMCIFVRLYLVDAKHVTTTKLVDNKLA